MHTGNHQRRIGSSKSDHDGVDVVEPHPFKPFFVLEGLQAPDEGQVGLLSGFFKQPAAEKKLLIRSQITEASGTRDPPARPFMAITGDIASLDGGQERLAETFECLSFFEETISLACLLEKRLIEDGTEL